MRAHDVCVAYEHFLFVHTTNYFCNGGNMKTADIAILYQLCQMCISLHTKHRVKLKSPILQMSVLFVTFDVNRDANEQYFYPDNEHSTIENICIFSIFHAECLLSE